MHIFGADFTIIRQEEVSLLVLLTYSDEVIQHLSVLVNKHKVVVNQKCVNNGDEKENDHRNK